jgi:GNAT superfamily N-acetyltransferase
MHYRTFRNTDPPGLAAVWNAAFHDSRAAVGLRTPTLLEYFIFAKPYFDPQGLILAEEDGRPAGFALAGPGFSADGARADPAAGVVCAVGVAPEFRRRGVGSELLARAEAYLRGLGARGLLAGPMPPQNPFGFGLYGGSQSPGFLDSDADARPFFLKHGYADHASRMVFHRPLDEPLAVADARFAAHRQRYDVHVGPLSGATWREECVYGALELHEYRLVEKTTGRLAARAALWEMETFGPGWNEHAVGVADLVVPPELRRKGLAKFLLVQVLRHLHEQFYTLAEMQAPEGDAAVTTMLLGLGFTKVDRGVAYRREA